MGVPVSFSSALAFTVLKIGGFTTGGLHFDAKVRRESFEPIDPSSMRILAVWMRLPKT